MRRIVIVGGGQAGLPLAIGLLDKGYAVTLVTNRTPDELRRGKVMSSQCMFDASLQIERDLGLDQWARTCPPVQGIGLTVPHPAQPGERLIDWACRLHAPAQAVDQRLKMPAWMELFQARGGRLGELGLHVHLARGGSECRGQRRVRPGAEHFAVVGDAAPHRPLEAQVVLLLL